MSLLISKGVLSILPAKKKKKEIAPLHGLLPKISVHVRNFDDAKTMSFLSMMKNYW